MEALSSFIGMSGYVPLKLRQIISRPSTFSSMACAEVVREICIDPQFSMADNCIRFSLHDFAVNCPGGEIVPDAETRPFLRQHGHRYGIVEVGRSKFWKKTALNARTTSSLLGFIERRGLAGCRVADIVAESDGALVRQAPAFHLANG